MRADLVSFGVIGAIVGVGIGLATLPWSSVAVTEVVAPTAAAPLATTAPRLCPEAQPHVDELERIRLEIAVARARVATLQAERTAIAGDPIDWPDDIPADLGPDRAEALLDAAAQAADVDILGIECEEFPCVAVISRVQGPDDSVGDFNDAISGPFGDVVSEAGGRVWRDAGLWGVDGDDRRLALYWAELVPVEGDYERTGDLARRAGFRAKALGDIVIAEELERLRSEPEATD